MAGHNHLPALVTLSSRGMVIARKLARETSGVIYVHRDAGPQQEAVLFDRIMDLTAELFARHTKIVYILPVGVAVRAVADLVRHKLTDPAVVVVDVGCRWAVSLLSGHEGGANDLAMQTANILGCQPVITTSTQAEKDIVVGIGCRKGAQAKDIISALRFCLEKAGIELHRVRLLASADIKKSEEGLIKAADRLGIPLYFLSSSVIRNIPLKTAESQFVMDQVGLPGVAEPCALLCASNPKLILGKTVCASVTIAIARENSL
ncbi:MAG: cobalamin biosynthesis protein [Desulfonatronovibrio sp.]